MNSLTSKLNNDENPQYIQIRTKTWNRDSHGLFDYENNQVKTTTSIVNSNGSLVRKENEVIYETKDVTDNEEENIRKLATIKVSNSQYLLVSQLDTNLPVNNKTLTDLQEKIWYVVKSNNSNISILNTNNSYLSSYKYELRKNDIIKLGRIKFVIKDMNIVDGNYETSTETFRPYQECERINLSEGETCRICYSTVDESENNPMISICKCKGTVNLIHLECLKLWLKQKLTIKEIVNKPGISHTIKSFNCEICKEPYPTTIKFEGKLYHLMNYFVPEGQNFIILESLNSIKENEYPLSLHVLMFIDNNDSFILGRGHESDLRISDISVSRAHAKIFIQNNKFILEDAGSKFGTLVLAKEPVSIDSNSTILQIGRTLIEVHQLNPDGIRKKSNKEEKISIPDSKNNVNNIDFNLIDIEKFILNDKDGVNQNNSKDNRVKNKKRDSQKSNNGKNEDKNEEDNNKKDV